MVLGARPPQSVQMPGPPGPVGFQAELTEDSDIPEALFQGSIADSLRCKVCSAIPGRVVSCRECQAVICASCAQEWAEKKAGRRPFGQGSNDSIPLVNVPCVVCKQASLRQLKGPLFTQLLEAHILKCPNESMGCQHTGGHQATLEHLPRCDWAIIPCPRKGCIYRGARKNMDAHDVACPKRPVECQKCGSSFPQGELEAHASECTAVLVACPSQGCEMELTRGGLARHLEVECAHVLIRCDFCNDHLLRSELTAHLTAPDHLLDLFRRCKENEGLKDEVAALRFEIAEMKGQMGGAMARGATDIRARQGEGPAQTIAPPFPSWSEAEDGSRSDFSSAESPPLTPPESPHAYRVLMLGLDSAGKSTILTRMAYGYPDVTQPTIGFNVERVQHNNTRMQIWDVGGQQKLRPLWRHYFQGTDVLVFVFDLSDRERWPAAKEELDRLLRENGLRDASLLVIGNKTDLPFALSRQEVTEGLALDSRGQRDYRIVLSCGITGEGINDALDSLTELLGSIAL